MSAVGVEAEAGAEAAVNRRIPFPTPALAPLLMAADRWAIPRHMPMPALALALWALLGVTAMGLEYEFEYGEDSNCPRECKSPIEAVARRTPMRDKSAMSSTVGGAAEGTGTCGGAGWTLGLTGWTVGVFVLLLSVSSWGSW